MTSARITNIATESDFISLAKFARLKGSFNEFRANCGSLTLLLREEKLPEKTKSIFAKNALFILNSTGSPFFLVSATPLLWQKIVDALRAQTVVGTHPLADEIARAIANYFVPPTPLKLGSKLLHFGGKPYVMGIVNITPDSFHPSSRTPLLRSAVKRGLSLVAEGARIIDVGGESTRPGSDPVSAETELERVIPVVNALSREGVAVSIDTRKPEIAERALDAGAVMINDVSGLRYSAKLADVAKRYDSALCLMHSKATPKTMQKKVSYKDAPSEVIEELSLSIEKALEQGVAIGRIVVDPGIGFSKRLQHNLALIRRLGELRVFGRPILIGLSRKAFIEHATGVPVEERLPGTITANALAIFNGANIIRVHDVKEAMQTVKLVHALVNPLNAEI